jgi:type I restriction enzyme, S subunit
MTDLPEGWAEAALGEILNVRYGKSLPQKYRSPEGRYPVVGSAGRMATTDAPLVRAPVLVIGRKGNIGAVQFEPKGCWPIDTTYFVEIPSTFEPKFLLHQLVSLRLQRLDSSTATPSLRRQDLESQPVVRPPVREQRRIVEMLEEHLSHLDAAEQSLSNARVRLATWQRSVLDYELTEPVAPIVKIQDILAEPMRNGHSASATKDDSGIRTLTLTAVTKSEFSDVFTKLTSAEPGRVKNLWLRPDDIFVQRSNTPELVGSSAIYKGPSGWAIFPDLLIRLRVNKSIGLPDFVALALRSERVHQSMRARAKGLASSMPKIDQGTIGSTPIPLPGLDDQVRIVKKMSDVYLSARRQERTLVDLGSRMVALRRALLEAAFSGRLTGRSSDMYLVEEMAGV